MTQMVTLSNLLLMVDNDTNGMPVRYPEFADRVRDAAEKQGVTVTQIKDTLKVTYEMARRYYLGMAMPRKDKMEALAALLKIDAGALQWGQQGGSSTKNTVDIMQAAWPFSVSKARFDRLPKDEKERIDGLIEHTITAWEHRTQMKSKKAG
ncbi:hypothetical protein [Herbaspirillum chlorophenolicum]|uniref:hypothetical protein n=1 Tax=Herbaspirillum chlorophenolicum TaxID=211589 RepID=UPI00067CFF2F|nr:hypothetical protein [Herbaspirillum chlorophenolicum]